MAEATAIGWCDHTFNGWQGCQHVSPACDSCYAEAQDARFGCLRRWGPHGERERTSEANWRKPILWNKRAGFINAVGGERRRAFAMSKADVFDNKVPRAWRADFWRLVHTTPHLDWLILTKRPGNILRLNMLPEDWGDGYPNVWLGTTVESAEYNTRVLDIIAVPAVLHFVSAEPLLGDPQLHCIPFGDPINGVRFNSLTGMLHCGGASDKAGCYGGRRIRWVIVGGESVASRTKARRMPPELAWDVAEHCAEARTAFYFKQWGSWLPMRDGSAAFVGTRHVTACDYLGGPQEFPTVPHV
jgi:protein gp37